MTSITEADIQGQLARLTELRAAIGQAIVGQSEVVEQLLIGLLAGGHCLLEGCLAFLNLLSRSQHVVVTFAFSPTTVAEGRPPARPAATRVLVMLRVVGLRLRLAAPPLLLHPGAQSSAGTSATGVRQHPP